MKMGLLPGSAPVRRTPASPDVKQMRCGQQGTKCTFSSHGILFQGNPIPASSQTKAMEILFVAEGIKPVARILEDAPDNIKAWCTKENLFFEQADFKIQLHTEKEIPIFHAFKKSILILQRSS